MSLPWYQFKTMDPMPSIARGAWTSTPPDWVMRAEFAALLASGQVGGWSLRQLAERWSTGRKRARRVLMQWAADAASQAWPEDLLDAAVRAHPWMKEPLRKRKSPEPIPKRDQQSQEITDTSEDGGTKKEPQGDHEGTNEEPLLRACSTETETEAEEENPPTPQRGKRKKPSVWEAPPEVQALAESMRESWGGRLSWSVSSPLQGMSRLQCLGWWLGLYESEGRPRNPEPYSAEEIQAAWEVYLDEDWARAPGRGIMTFLRLAQLPKWCEAGTPPLFPTQSVDYIESYDLGSMSLEDAEAAFTRPSSWGKNAQGDP